MTRRRVALRALLTIAVAAAAVLVAMAGLTGGARRGAPNLQSLLDDIGASGAPGAIALTRVGNESSSFESGFADPTADVPLEAADRFRIGSITKTFVATRVLQLVGEGRIHLEDPVERWLPKLLLNGRRISVRQLLAHRSGLFD